jgi:hypothetical protein
VSLSDRDWEIIHSLEFVDQPQCWTTCGGGFCCKTNSPFLKLNFMKPNSAGMVFFQGEYDFLERNGVMQEGFKSQSRFWKFSFADVLELRFATSVCSLEGKCSIPRYRPLLCKLYPFLPRINFATLDVVGYINASVVDQLWTSLGVPEPCTLAREKAEAIQRQMQPGIDVLKRYPYVLFYIKAAELFLDDISDNFEKLKQAHTDWSNDHLVANWELSYLSGRAFDTAVFRRRLQEQYACLRKTFKNFDLEA